MAARRQTIIKQVPKVTGSTTVTFKLVLEGEWDWNRDIAGAAHDSIVSNCKKTLREAIQEGLANRVFDRCDNMFESAQLTECGITPEMEQVYAQFKGESDEMSRKAKEQALADAEERAARLRAELGR